MITKDAIRATLETRNLPHATALAALAEDGVVITTTRTAMSALAIGASRFGGVPDLPPDFAWPMRGERPLTFVAQIELAAARAPDLPPRGALVFFYDTVEEPWGFDPKHGGGWDVRLVADGTPLVRAHAAAASDRRAPFEAAALGFAPRAFLPAPDDVLVRPLLASEPVEVYRQYDSAVHSVRQEGPLHRLRGHPWLVQGDLRGECQLVANGLYAGNHASYQTPAARTLLPAAGSIWTLLLQIDTDEAGPGWMWGDVGSLYFMIRREDLLEQRFDRVWLIQQCC